LRGDRFSLAHIGTIELLNGFSGVSARWNPDRESNDFDINAIAGDAYHLFLARSALTLSLSSSSSAIDIGGWNRVVEACSLNHFNASSSASRF
jgi:hypothetical protein